jgi:hypothetical protein
MMQKHLDKIWRNTPSLDSFEKAGCLGWLQNVPAVTAASQESIWLDQ